MYTFLLLAHSGLRWLILLACAISVAKSIISIFSNAHYTRFDKMTVVVFVNLMRLQFVIGLLLYFIFSPITTRFTFNFNSLSDLFWPVIHFLLMTLALGASEIGSGISKKSGDAVIKFRFQAIFFSVSLLLMIVGIPWKRM